MCVLYEIREIWWDDVAQIIIMYESNLHITVYKFKSKPLKNDIQNLLSIFYIIYSSEFSSSYIFFIWLENEIGDKQHTILYNLMIGEFG